MKDPGRAVERAWATRGLASTLLLPLSWLYAALASIDRARAVRRRDRTRDQGRRVPVIVVGNLVAGGTGKTPLVAALVPFFAARGRRCGIVSRGYGGVRQTLPVVVGPDDSARRVGDEPLMLARATGAPVCVCVDRAAAVRALAARDDVDLVLSDDGLQHHAMRRDLEICVIDARRGLGNGRLLPAGPLREGVARLGTVDIIAIRETGSVDGAADEGDAPGDGTVESVVDAEAVAPLPASARDVAHGGFRVELGEPVRLGTGATVALSDYRGCEAHAVAGIGRPAAFFDALSAAGVEVIAHPFPDHHDFTSADLDFGDRRPVFMTSKDAVKIAGRDVAVPAGVELIEVRARVRLDDALVVALDAACDRLTPASRSTRTRSTVSRDRLSTAPPDSAA